MSAFDTRPFWQARRDIRDIVSIPVMVWMAFSRPRRTTEAYRALMDIPMDLASIGYEVTVSQTESGWHVELKKEVVEGSVLEMSGDARSYAAALFQITESAEITIGDLEKQARRAWNAAQEVTAA